MKTNLASMAFCFAAAVYVAGFVFPTCARADEEYRVVVRERELNAYPLEIEPHFSFGPENVYGADGFGGGLRLSIPVVPGFLTRVHDNLALSVGGDLIHYDKCYYGAYCSANYLMVPAAAQWNVFLGRHFSLFAEGGAFFYRGWFDECAPGDLGCSAPSDLGVLPTLAIGGRIHLGPHTAFTARLGYPTTTLGLSFM